MGVLGVSFLLLGTGLVVDLVKLRAGLGVDLVLVELCAGLGVAFVPITTVFVIKGTGLEFVLVIMSSGQ